MLNDKASSEELAKQRRRDYMREYMKNKRGKNHTFKVSDDKFSELVKLVNAGFNKLAKTPIREEIKEMINAVN